MNYLTIYNIILSFLLINILKIHSYKILSKNTYNKVSIHNTQKLLSNTINSPVLDFAPWLELHHIVLLRDATNPGRACTIDFSPKCQTSPDTLKNLLLGKYVPGEIRVNWIEDFDGETNTLKTLSIQSTKMSTKYDHRYSRFPINRGKDDHMVQFVNRICDKWSTDMNFYVHNCQHFSDFVHKELKYGH